MGCQSWFYLLGLRGVIDCQQNVSGMAREVPKMSWDPTELSKGDSVGGGGAFVEEDRLRRITEVTESQHLPGLCAVHGLDRRTWQAWDPLRGPECRGGEGSGGEGSSLSAALPCGEGQLEGGHLAVLCSENICGLTVPLMLLQKWYGCLSKCDHTQSVMGFKYPLIQTESHAAVGTVCELLDFPLGFFKPEAMAQQSRDNLV